MTEIDTSFDFTSDTPGYWDDFWENNGGLGHSNQDPDARSPMLREYHARLWSGRALPNGEVMKFTMERQYLLWKDFRFSSDSITATFRHPRDINIIGKVMEAIPNYHAYVEGYIHKLYTIGGMMIFPVTRGSINQDRGCHPLIRDRFDLTLECIRRHYEGRIDNPLWKTFESPVNKAFLDLFIDFKGFVDFFFLNDLVTEDYRKVILWYDWPLFEGKPVPKDVETYKRFISNELEFVERRNRRIDLFCREQSSAI